MAQPVQAHVVPLVNITGTLTALGAVHRALLPEYHRWQNDADVNRTRIFTPRPLAEEAVSAWYDRISRQDNIDNPTLLWIVSQPTLQRLLPLSQRRSTSQITDASAANRCP